MCGTGQTQPTVITKVLHQIIKDTLEASKTESQQRNRYKGEPDVNCRTPQAILKEKVYDWAQIKMEETEGKISELEHRIIEITQHEQWRENRQKK